MRVIDISKLPIPTLRDKRGSTHSHSPSNPVTHNDPCTGMIAASSYVVTSITLAFLNNYIVHMYDFHYPAFVAFAQICLTLMIMHPLRYLGIISYEDFRIRRVMDVLPLSICFLINVTFGISSLSRITISSFMVVRRFTSIFVIYLEERVLNRTYGVSVWRSVLLMVFGSALMEMSHSALDFSGIILGFFFDFTTAMYFVLIRKLTFSMNISPLTLLWINSIVSMPLSFLLSGIFMELGPVSQSPLMSDKTFVAIFFMCLFLGFGLNMAIFLCTHINSPLTTSAIGNAKHVFALVISELVFPTISDFHHWTVVGMITNIIGSVWFFYIKIRHLHTMESKARHHYHHMSSV